MVGHVPRRKDAGYAGGSGITLQAAVRAYVAAFHVQLAFEDAGRSVQLDDPLTALVADFVARAREGVDPEAERRTRRIAARAALLERLVSAWRLQTEAA